jgi:hypothetical protein
MIEHDRTRARRALVEGEDVLHGSYSVRVKMLTAGLKS